jgi:Arc/MetJ family transcription regulator
MLLQYSYPVRAIFLCVRTTLDIDAQLMEAVVRLSGKRTKAAAVEAALEEYVRQRRKELLLGLPGRVRLEENWRDLREAELGD